MGKEGTEINIIKFTFVRADHVSWPKEKKSEDHYLIFVSVGAMPQPTALKYRQTEGYLHLPVRLTR